MKKTKLNIPNKEGEDLHAVLELPANGQPAQYAIFAHCFTCNSELSAVRNISRALTSHGFGVVRFDFTGLGESEGDFSDTNFSANIHDLETVNEHIIENYSAPTLLVGHSLGGAAVLVAANKLDNIKAVATVGAPAEANHVKHIFEDKIDEIREKGSAEVSIGGRPFVIKKQFVDDLESNNVMKNIGELKKPILVMHSPQDNIVSIENAADIYKAAFHPKSFISLDGADHLLSKRRDSNYAGNIIGSWVERYLEVVDPEEEKPDTDGADVAAHLNTENNYTVQITNGRKTIVADEPKSLGGEDQGFAPMELVNAGLGACTSITMKMYADRKKWDLKHVFVYLDHNKKEASEVEGAEGENGKVNHIDKRIEIVGDLDEKQRKRLLEIAEKCPVNKALKSKFYIDSAEYKDE